MKKFLISTASVLVSKSFEALHLFCLIGVFLRRNIEQHAGVTKGCFLKAFEYFRIFKKHPFECPGRADYSLAHPRCWFTYIVGFFSL